MCFLCCYYSQKVDNLRCESHCQQTIEREREDHYIEEGLAKKKAKKVSLPVFCEEKFTDVGQTVVIWCMKDFCTNKKYAC
jgi:hypothetical protein